MVQIDPDRILGIDQHCLKAAEWLSYQTSLNKQVRGVFAWVIPFIRQGQIPPACPEVLADESQQEILQIMYKARQELGCTSDPYDRICNYLKDLAHR